MTVGKSEILDIVRTALSSGRLKASSVYWYKKELRAGDTAVSIPGMRAMPFDGTLVFVDLAPNANWAHPCLYLLIESKTLAVKVVEASLPPAIDQYDENFVVIKRFNAPMSEGRADDELDIK
jgi:hypothetical protein